MKIFDSHFHIIDFNFPITENNGYLPPEFKVADYRREVQDLGINEGVVVSGSFHAFDQDYLLHALHKLGGNFYGVTNIPFDMSDDKLDELNGANVKGVRFNLVRGGSESISKLDYLSNKLFEKYDWHTELYVNSGDLKSLGPILKTLKRFSIDHLGLISDGRKELLSWVERGVKVKATGFGRFDLRPIQIMKEINSIDPSALMFGTDLPSTRAKVPFSTKDIQLIRDNFSKRDCARIMYENARSWYKR